jgi:CheY-like chemotaxis protein
MNRWIKLARELAIAEPRPEPLSAAHFLGLRLVAVEREAPVALLLREFLSELGCTVVGVALDAPDALALIEAHASALDGAIVDGDLDPEGRGRLIEALRSSAIPFVVATSAPRGRQDEAAEGPLLIKPYTLARLKSALRQHLVRRLGRPGQRPDAHRLCRGRRATGRLPSTTARRTRHG